MLKDLLDYIILQQFPFEMLLAVVVVCKLHSIMLVLLPCIGCGCCVQVTLHYPCSVALYWLWLLCASYTPLCLFCCPVLAVVVVCKLHSIILVLLPCMGCGCCVQVTLHYACSVALYWEVNNKVAQQISMSSSILPVDGFDF